MITNFLRTATNVLLTRPYSSKSAISPMMQVFRNAMTGKWEPVANDIRPKTKFEWLNPADFPLKKEVEIHQEPGRPPQRVSVHLSAENRGWVEVDAAGQPKSN